MVIKNTRNTIHRSRILEYLKRVKIHPSAEKVYQEIKKELPTITLATVYRNLHHLASEGKILRLGFGNEYRFDGDVTVHQHCFCERCGKILDQFNLELPEYR